MRTLKKQGCKYHRHWSSHPRPTLPFATALHSGTGQWRHATVLSWTAGSAAFPIVVAAEIPEASPAHWLPVVVGLFDITGQCDSEQLRLVPLPSADPSAVVRVPVPHLGRLRERHAAFALLHPHPWEEPYYVGARLNGRPVRIPGVLEIASGTVIVGVIIDAGHSSSSSNGRAVMWDGAGRPLGAWASDNPEGNRLDLNSLRPGPSPQAVARAAERQAAFERDMAVRRRTPKRRLKPRDSVIIDNPSD